MEQNNIPTPAERAKAEMDRLLGITPEVKEEKIIPPHGIYMDETGREHNMDDIQAQGSFYIKPEVRETVKLCIIFTIPALMITAAVITLVSLALIRGSPIPMYVFIIFEVAVFIATELIALYLAITKARGPLYKYKADGRAFYVQEMGFSKVTGEEKVLTKQQIMFKDVLGVSYTPTTLFMGDRGYKVEILTTNGMIRFDYIFPRYKHVIAPEFLPFDVLKRNIPISDENADDGDKKTEQK